MWKGSDKRSLPSERGSKHGTICMKDIIRLSDLRIKKVIGSG